MSIKQLILFALTASACHMAGAQNISHDFDLTMFGCTETIVRSYDPNYAVSFYWSGNNNYLDVEKKYIGHISRIDMPNEINIKDMYVDQMNNILYFCGTTASPNQSITAGVGVLGWINLSDIISWPAVTINWTTIADVSVVTKLAEYTAPGVNRIVAIGAHHWTVEPYSYTRYYFINCPNAITSLNNIYLTPFTADEKYHDIVLTDNYIVCFGYNTDLNINSICYRKTSKIHVYDSIFDEIHYFVGGDEPHSITHTTALKGDSVLTTYLHYDNYYFVTRLRTIDVGSDIMTHSQDYIHNDKTAPSDIVYLSDATLAVLMHNFKLGGTTNSNFVFINPYPNSNTTYNAKVEYLKGISFHSLTKQNSDSYLAGLGASWFYRCLCGFHPPADCPSFDNIKVWAMPIWNSEKIISPVNRYNLPCPLYGPTEFVDFQNAIRICND